MTRSLVVTLLCCLLPCTALAQNAQPSPAELERMLEPLRPTTQHRELAMLEGRWTMDISYNFGSGPVKATGTTQNRMALGQRFLVSEGRSNNPTGMGDPVVEFLTIYGFDRRTSDYTIVGFDTMGTYYVTAAGKKTPAGTLLMTGETLELEAGTRLMRKYDMTLRVVDANTYVTEIIFKFAGQPDQTIVSITHRRAQ